MASRLKEEERNEKTIRNLLKLPENRRCINCNSLGPQYVCTNFSTFVCTTCSGIHREFTHRVKSVSMAKFTSQEVSALQGGGNASAREIYLKEWDPQRNSLPDGSNVERLRDFIKHVFVDRRYTGERNLEKPLREKMGENDDVSGNRRMDTYQGGSRSPPYEDTFERRDGGRPSLGGRSPGYDQGSRKNNDYKRNEVVNDWRREDRFGDGRRSEDRSSDGSSKLEGRSPERDSDMSSPPMVRPVRDILGDNVSPLRVIEPPKAPGAKSSDGSVHTQRSASFTSLASADANPPEVRLEASLIDFDSASDPPITVNAPKTQQVATDASAGQLKQSSNNNWANFDSGPEVKVHTSSSNSLESILSHLSIPAPTSGPSRPVDKFSLLQSNGLQGSSYGSSFGNVAPPSVFPPGGAPAASLGQAPQSANIERSFLANVPTGGQLPSMNPQQRPVLPGGITQSVAQLVTPGIGGSSSNKPWNLAVMPSAHGPPGISQVAQAETKPAIDTSLTFLAESSLDAKSVGRKELPEDLFSFNYSYAPPQVSGWYSGSPYAAGAPMQYMPMAVPNIQPALRSTNPFDFGNDPSPAQAPTLPSMASLQGALLKTGTQPGLQRSSSLGAPVPHPPSVIMHVPPFASATLPSSFIGQQIAGSLAPRPQVLPSFSSEDPAFVSNPSHQPGRLHPAHSAPNLSSAGGNPFG